MGSVHLDIVDRVACVTLDAPPANALDRAMVAALDDVLARCERDDAVRCLVVRGAGSKTFCAGSDLDELKTLVARGRPALESKFAQDDAVFGRLAHAPIPTVAAIEGAAIGGGLELAACCDLIVAGRGAKLGLPEIRLGVFPGSGGTVRVTRRVGPGRARQMMLLGDSIDAASGLAWGLLNDVVDDGRAVERALEWARRLATGPSLAQEGCKAALDAAADLGEGEALAASRRWAVDLGSSADLAEGLRAFDEKRRPVFGADRIRRR